MYICSHETLAIESHNQKAKMPSLVNGSQLAISGIRQRVNVATTKIATAQPTTSIIDNNTRLTMFISLPPTWFWI